VFSEARQVRARRDADLARHISLLQLAVGSLLSKEAGQALEKQLKSMTE